MNLFNLWAAGLEEEIEPDDFDTEPNPGPGRTSWDDES